LAGTTNLSKSGPRAEVGGNVRHVMLRSSLALISSRHVDACKQPWLEFSENELPTQNGEYLQLKSLRCPNGQALHLISLSSEMYERESRLRRGYSCGAIRWGLVHWPIAEL